MATRLTSEGRVRQLLDAAVEVQTFLQSQSWEFCLIGALAAIRWGEPRATRDVDISLLTGFGDEEEFMTPLFDQFVARVDDPLTFTRQSRVALLTASNGVPIDISFGAIPFEADVIRRATEFEYEPGYRLLTASAEDLLIMKSLAGRPQDLLDVEGIVVRQWDHLDWDRIHIELENLAEYFPESDAPVRLQALRDEVARQFGPRKKSTKRNKATPSRKKRRKR
jgi:hypothetical protein